MTWNEGVATAIARYEAGETRGLDQRQLTQLANAACAARRYRESWDAGAPPDAWGRPIAAMKALLIAGDDASEPAQWALDVGAAESDSPIGRYAAVLAYLVLHRDVEARMVAETLVERDDFPRDVADALLMIA